MRSLLIVAMLAAPSVALAFLNQYDRYIDSGIETSYQPNGQLVVFTADLIHLGDIEMAQLNEYLIGLVNPADRHTHDGAVTEGDLQARGARSNRGTETVLSVRWSSAGNTTAFSCRQRFSSSRS